MKIWFMKHFLKNCYKKYLNEKEQVNKLKIEIYNNYDSFNKIVKFYDDVFPSRSYPIRHIIFQLNKKRLLQLFSVMIFCLMVHLNL